jgi:ribosome-associated translation inhibitor RaiA
MQTTITARHCEISGALRDRVGTIAERLGAVARRPMELAVVFDLDGAAARAELRLHVARGELFVASGEGPDHRTALDRAEEKLRRQAEKAFGVARGHRARGSRGDDRGRPVRPA